MRQLFTFFFILTFTVMTWSRPPELDHLMLTPDKLIWIDAPASLSSGAKLALIHGDSKAKELFSMRIKVPNGWEIRPHFHPDDEHVTVIQGSFWMGTGEKWEPDKMHEIPTGGFARMTKGTRHYGMAKAETIIQIHAMGPWGITYVNPADDPRTGKK